MADPALTYAIGDIHGRGDLLDALLDRIETHAAGRRRRLVFVGDYIDRGPDSAGVIETLRRLQWREPNDVVCLKGNHEAMLLKSLHEPGAREHWLSNGGEQTLESFGARGPEDVSGDVFDWIEGLPTLHEDALRYYVHAGFRPGTAAEDTDTETRIWIREPFLSEEQDFGRHVVHGHTPSRNGEPDARRFRTNVDTGAVYGGALTAGVFTAEQAAPVEFLQVRAED